jgi:hypothetical protein
MPLDTRSAVANSKGKGDQVVAAGLTGRQDIGLQEMLPGLGVSLSKEIPAFVGELSRCRFSRESNLLEVDGQGDSSSTFRQGIGTRKRHEEIFGKVTGNVCVSGTCTQDVVEGTPSNHQRYLVEGRHSAGSKGNSDVVQRDASDRTGMLVFGDPLPGCATAARDSCQQTKQHKRV